MSITSTPIYGVEPYNPLNVPVADTYGGGADVTQENLLVTLWTLPDDDDLTIAGQLIKPITRSAGSDFLLGFLGPVAHKSGTRSRLSAKIGFDESDSEAGPPSMIAFLNPPQELREAFLLNDAASPTYMGLNTYLSLAGQLMWGGLAVNPEGGVIDADIVFSGVGGSSSVIPYAKSNGADGVWPEFWPLLGDPAFPDMLNAFRAGLPFYVAVVIQSNEDTGFVTLSWPFSGGARG